MAGALIRELHDASYRRLVLELLAHADDLPTAEQAVREAFVDAYRRGRAVQDAADPIGLLRDSAVETLRRRRRRACLFARLPFRRMSRSPSTDSRLLPESRAALAAVTRLPRDQRTAVVLRHIVELSLPETAAALGRSAHDVQSLLRLARSRLDPELSADGPRHADRLGDLAQQLLEIRSAAGQ
jgi:RNA polymerase sigma-70 factor (ECF subfamily)